MRKQNLMKNWQKALSITPQQKIIFFRLPLNVNPVDATIPFSHSSFYRSLGALYRHTRICLHVLSSSYQKKGYFLQKEQTVCLSMVECGFNPKSKRTFFQRNLSRWVFINYKTVKPRPNLKSHTIQSHGFFCLQQKGA